MDIQQLKNFSLVAKMGSITHAAEALHVSQPNLSMNIKRLETDLGAQLFDRSKTKIKLTPVGQLFLEYVDSALSTLDEGIDKVHSLYTAPTKTISIAASDDSWLIPLVSKYHKMNVNRAIRTMVFDNSAIIPALLKGEISFSLGPECAHPDALEWIPFYTERIGIMVSVNHPFAQRSCLKMKELKQERFILNVHQYPLDFVKQMFMPANFSPNIICECNDGPIVGSMIEENAGITLVDIGSADIFEARNSTSPVVLVPLEETVERKIGVLHMKNTVLPIPVEQLTSAYQSYFQILPYVGPPSQPQA